MAGSWIGVLLFAVLANALQHEVIFVEPDGVKLRVKDEPSLLGIKFEVQPSGQITRTQLVSNSAGGVWEFFDPDMKVRSGDIIRYKITATYEENEEETGWIAHELDSARHVRSMKRAAHVLFKDDYNQFHKEEYTLGCSAWGGGNGEFQAYVPEDANLYVRDGIFYLRPTLTVDNKAWDENRLYHGNMNLKTSYGCCTQASNWGCDRTAVKGHILNPVMSGKVTTHASIRYGKLNVRARIPRGDWIWPAIWMLPRDWHYGGWPRSGEIDLMESRGNRVAMSGNDNQGVGEVGSTLHWGPDSGQNRFYKTHAAYDKPGGGDWSDGFHLYTLEWYEDHISTYVDNHRVLYIPTPGNGFWGWGGFGGSNIWSSGGRNAPFDQPFQLILNVAVGGAFFSSGMHYDHNRPWNNDDRQFRTFWERRGEWLPTWHGEKVAMAIDYVEMIQA